MIASVSIANFKGIKEISDLPLSRFHLLVGPNGSGKSTFLDALEFVKDMLLDGPAAAVNRRAPDLADLTHMRQGGEIRIALRLEVVSSAFAEIGLYGTELADYELVVRQDDDRGVVVDEEALTVHRPRAARSGAKVRSTAIKLVGRTSKLTCFYTRENGKYQDPFSFGSDRLALSWTPTDEEKYPTANAVRRMLTGGLAYLQLNSRAMREPCPATEPTELKLDGTNLARVIGRLWGGNGSGRNGAASPAALEPWVDELSTALPGLRSVGWGQREADNAEYFVLRFDNGLECPSWLASDGTLRLLALTILRFLPAVPHLLLVEEPENGLHPLAIETVVRDLRAAPLAQVLVATHSPLVVANVERDDLLCFSTDAGVVSITRGSDHPRLKLWADLPNLADVFAAGIL